MGPSTDGNTESTLTTSQQTGNTATESVATATESTTTVVPTTEAPLCPPGVFMNIPNPERCDAFYMCASGLALPQFCPDGFEYSDNAQVSFFGNY